eukprot:4865675-Pyramimonas_sp.AAC.1
MVRFGAWSASEHGPLRSMVRFRTDSFERKLSHDVPCACSWVGAAIKEQMHLQPSGSAVRALGSVPLFALSQV